MRAAVPNTELSEFFVSSLPVSLKEKFFADEKLNYDLPLPLHD